MGTAIGRCVLVDREIGEDSRCQSDVTCVWAGRALPSVIVSSLENVLGFGAVELILESGLLAMDIATS